MGSSPRSAAEESGSVGRTPAWRSAKRDIPRASTANNPAAALQTAASPVSACSSLRVRLQLIARALAFPAYRERRARSEAVPLKQIHDQRKRPDARARAAASPLLTRSRINGCRGVGVIILIHRHQATLGK